VPEKNDAALHNLGNAPAALAPRAGRTWLWRILALIFLLAAPVARAQVFELGGGSSTLFEASGGSVEVQGQGYHGWLGLGSLDGRLRLGASLSEQWHGSTFTFGDEFIPFRLPTDIFDGSQYFLGRGTGISTTRGRITLLAFAGATATGFNAPFFRGARPEDGVGVFFLDVKLTPKLRVFSRNILSKRQTFINGIEWQPEMWLKTSVAGGVGANQGYLAYSLAAEQPWVTFKGAYILTSNDFRRIVVQSPLNAEIDGGNVSVTFHPKPFFDFSAGHSNLLEPTTTTQPGLRASVDQFSGSATAAQFRFSAALFRSYVQGITTQGTSLSVSRDFAHRFQASAYLFHGRSERQSSSTSLLASLREAISPRLSLLQTVTESAGHTSVAFGGDILTNPVAIGVSYQTVFEPFRTGNPFRQVLLLSLRIQPHGNLLVNLGSYVAPDGSVKYTGYGQTSISRGEAASAPSSMVGLAKYVIRGRVVDEQGQPVPGAALRIDKDLVFTNSEGEFFVRRKSAKSCPLEVVQAEFLTPGVFDVVSGPSSVTPLKEGSETPVVVLLRHHPTTP
jgi:hypothetical protein